jgi:hypothetical protein
MLSPTHHAATVDERGWKGFRNGALLRAADTHFDVIVTADQSIRFQQSFTGLQIALVVLPTNRLRKLRNAVPARLQSLNLVRTGRHIVMDLGADSDRWANLQLRSIVTEGDLERHIFALDTP